MSPFQKPVTLTAPNNTTTPQPPRGLITSNHDDDANPHGRHLEGRSTTGDPAQALTHYQVALPIQRQVGNRAGEAVTRYNLALLYRATGQLDRAVSELEHAVELERDISHPDLAADTATLEDLLKISAPNATTKTPGQTIP